jgi:ribose-phosphate pyrophosphokinase
MPLKSWNFPAGEVGVEIELPTDCVSLAHYVCRLRSGRSDDILRVLMEADAAHRAGYGMVQLIAPYLPYGRQDRVTAPGTSFSLDVFTQLIRDRFESIVVVDAHSEATKALLDRADGMFFDFKASDLMPFFPVGRLPAHVRDMVVVAPDKGARERAERCAVVLGIRTVCYAVKHRNPETGDVESIEVEGVMPEDHVLIIDDICDGGATFIALAQALNCASKSLFVTHGIFSRGYQHVAQHFDLVVTTDSFDRATTEDNPPPEHVIALANIIPEWTPVP